MFSFLLSKSNRFYAIHIVSFELELTSYVIDGSEDHDDDKVCDIIYWLMIHTRLLTVLKITLIILSIWYH
jgi:hypothetical protein